ILFTELPNFACSFGALRLRWTMRIDLVSQYLCRLLAHMEENHFGVVQPVVYPEQNSPLHEFINSSQFNPGYAQRSRNLLARSGSTPEWQLSLDFWAESDQLPDANFLTNSLQFSSRGKP
ncbi:MAG: FAD-containing monooxygenase EthA, partial [Actinomycetes bacterium]